MSEVVIITAIICVTIAFVVFVMCGAEVSVSKNEALHNSLDGDHDFIDREEFEEYEHMVNERFEKLEKE